ncbi:hypothetical protein [Melittangium boletus]|uniref:hypothetical protein n=1 Tax=Melittangium boletus TaxID=83453 RepID=UPI003DA31656
MTSKDRLMAEKIERVMRANIPRAEVPREDPVFHEGLARRDAAPTRDPRRRTTA